MRTWLGSLALCVGCTTTGAATPPSTTSADPYVGGYRFVSVQVIPTASGSVTLSADLARTRQAALQGLADIAAASQILETRFGLPPRKQVIAQLCGVVSGIFFAVPIYKLFDAAYDIGGEEVPAPAAHAWKAMAELLANGFDSLPTHAPEAILGGLLFGALIPILRKVLGKEGSKYLPSGLAFGIAFIVPAYYSLAMFFGALMFLIWKKRRPEAAEKLGFSVASGLIAGEGLMGIVTAILTLLGITAITGGGGGH